VLAQRHVAFNPVVTSTDEDGNLGQHNLEGSQDDPFLSTVSASGTSSGTPAQAQHSPETFDLRTSLTLTDSEISDSEETPQAEPLVHSHVQRHQNAPRPVDPYPTSPTRARSRHQQHAEPLASESESGPAGNKRGRHTARDVYTFFEEKGHQVCKFCL
jgi:hypothetical protein